VFAHSREGQTLRASRGGPSSMAPSARCTTRNTLPLVSALVPRDAVARPKATGGERRLSLRAGANAHARGVRATEPMERSSFVSAGRRRLVERVSHSARTNRHPGDPPHPPDLGLVPTPRARENLPAIRRIPPIPHNIGLIEAAPPYPISEGSPPSPQHPSVPPPPPPSTVPARGGVTRRAETGARAGLRRAAAAR